VSCLLWNNDSYSVLIPAIDNEHKLLVALINEFETVLQINETLHSHFINEKLDKLYQCINSHFSSEERFLLFNNYPDFDSHVKEHSLLVDRLSSFKLRFNAENMAFNENMLLFIKDWLVRHILLYDRRYGEYFQGKELINEFG
jgi:hemerythrin